MLAFLILVEASSVLDRKLLNIIQLTNVYILFEKLLFLQGYENLHIFILKSWNTNKTHQDYLLLLKGWPTIPVTDNISC